MFRRFRNYVTKSSNKIIEFLFPPTCPMCASRVETHGELCGDCWSMFDWIDDAKCIVCGYPFPGNLDVAHGAMCPICAAGKNKLRWIRSACVYDDVSRSAMLPFKHSGQINNAHFMSRAMIWALRDVDLSDIDIVMPVPLATARLRHRGYNQATLLARPIARAMGCGIDLDSVRRAHREDMGHKTARQRIENIRGVFTVVHPELIRGRNILLVDDVMTTGATFVELARVLERAGALSVSGVSFCRVAHDD